ncbi:MAG: BrnA antitoxin family protein [Pontiellaceae bacterium]|jgi:predicted DNA binding CopG/RHH family protein|nr:BrnA antitoxin family protein [Pontiellaceae bacterium]
MKTNPKTTPKFKNEDEERDFWAEHSPLDFFDLSTAKRVTLPNLKPTTKSISIRLPESLINELKVLANSMDVPYQSLAKIYLSREVAMERRARFIDPQPLSVAEDSVEYGK